VCDLLCWPILLKNFPTSDRVFGVEGLQRCTCAKSRRLPWVKTAAAGRALSPKGSFLAWSRAHTAGDDLSIAATPVLQRIGREDLHGDEHVDRRHDTAPGEGSRLPRAQSAGIGDR
jgi:hypothetical protein